MTTGPWLPDGNSPCAPAGKAGRALTAAPGS